MRGCSEISTNKNTVLIFFKYFCCFSFLFRCPRKRASLMTRKATRRLPKSRQRKAQRHFQMPFQLFQLQAGREIHVVQDYSNYLWSWLSSQEYNMVAFICLIPICSQQFGLLSRASSPYFWSSSLDHSCLSTSQGMNANGVWTVSSGYADQDN